LVSVVASFLGEFWNMKQSCNSGLQKADGTALTFNCVLDLS